MVLRNYVVKQVDASHVVQADAYPQILLHLRPFADEETIRVETQRVDLDILLCASSTNAARRVPWEDIEERLDELFVHFLESTATTWPLNTWFDLLRLLDPTIPTYHLIASPETAAALLDTGVPEEGLHGYGFSLYHHWIEIVSLPYLADTMCYVIPPEYYVTYLYRQISGDSERVWASSFLDLSERGFRPIRISGQGVLDLLLTEPVGPQLPVPAPQSHLPAPPTKGDLQRRTEAQEGRPLVKCPVCGGKIQYLNDRDAFCLDCDWDNLRPIY